MESLILKTLGFYICVPTIVDFLERFLKATECSVSDSPKVESLAKVRSCVCDRITHYQQCCNLVHTSKCYDVNTTSCKCKQYRHLALWFINCMNNTLLNKQKVHVEGT